ncbi:NAD(P)-dependent alcohol dehydrogenase [Streptomyces anulatus]|uniref:NAD(P)-dependent alcohol dehydrogenase n=1 Tax=Streptomyces anulatus TaxID=1892 RepID=UPI0034156624
MNDMRAALYDRYGPPEVLYEGRVPVPVRKPGEVLVRVHAASVNGGELHGRAGRVRLVTGRRFPQRTGLDFVGEVAEVDPTVTGLRAGDRVWGLLGRTFGSAAEYVSVRPRQIAYAPGNVTPTEAVSLLAGGTTSLTALRDKAGLRAGERLLVRGASGGVGSVAVQLGKALGTHVTGLASAKNLDFVRDLGADEALDHRATPLADLDRYDVVLDTVGTEHRALQGRLSAGGRLVSIAFDIDRPVRSIGCILGSAVQGRRRVRFFSGNPKHDLLAELTAYVERGDLRPVVDTVRPLAEIAAAHRALEAGGVRGKHVIHLV